MEEEQDYFKAAAEIDSVAAFWQQPGMQRAKLALETLIRLTLLVLIVPFTVISDIILLGNRLGERSITEWSQALLLLTTVILCLEATRYERHMRVLYRLIAGFVGCMFIREHDLYFDALFYHGFWLIPALGLTALTMLVVWREWRNLVPAIAVFATRRAFPCFLFGFVIVFGLSRTLGSGRMLWEMLGGGDTHRLFKTIMQESLESVGYLFFAYGAFVLRREQQAGEKTSKG